MKTTPKNESILYAAVGAATGGLSAIVIGIAMQICMAPNPAGLARFEAQFWKMTMPCLLVVGGGAATVAHAVVSPSTKRSEDQPTHQPPPPTNYQPTHQPAPLPTTLPVVDVSGAAQPTTPNGNENHRPTNLRSIIGGRPPDFGG